MPPKVFPHAPRARALLLALTALTLVVACDTVERDESGQIVGSGTLDVALMKAGDCFQSLHEDILTLDDVPGVPCGEPHDNEVFHIFAVEGETWPGDEAVEAMAFNTCIDAFEVYLEVAWTESQLDFTWLSPTQRAWEQLGYREIVCFLYEEDRRLTGSMKASGR
jgi:hypothetical protein